LTQDACPELQNTDRIDRVRIFIKAVFAGPGFLTPVALGRDLSDQENQHHEKCISLPVKQRPPVTSQRRLDREPIQAQSQITEDLEVLVGVPPGQHVTDFSSDTN
jgi:hypothetical protein